MIQATVVADTINNGNRITTMVVTLPKSRLAQLNKHRIISNNAESSRAVPTKTVLNQIIDNPYVPTDWPLPGPGMSAAGYETDPKIIALNVEEWLSARDSAVRHIERFGGRVQKEEVNRLAEPWMWCNVVLTSTTWSNFFTLRNASNADYPMQLLAAEIETELRTSVPFDSYWHLPFIDRQECSERPNFEYWSKISVARCAQISYNRAFEKNVEKDLARYQTLFDGKHWSAFEHTAYSCNGQHKNFTGWRSVRCDILGEEDASL